MIFLAGAAVLAIAACGSSDPPETPSPCLGTASEYLAALESAPGEVLLAGETPISACLVEEQPPGSLAGVGRSVVEAAKELNREAGEKPGGAATVQLGYLVGAIQEAASTTGGIHRDLVLRLDSAARFSPGGEPLSAAFERSFGEGYAAGQSGG